MTTDRMLDIIQYDLGKLYGPDHYYTTTYRKEERNYFGKIPYWLADHLLRLKVSGIKSPKVLDIGPAYGTLLSLAWIHSGILTGIDRLPYMDLRLASKYGVTIILGDVERQPIPGGPYDAIILTEVLEHFNFFPVPTLTKIRGALSPVGKLFLSTPNADSWGRTDTYSYLADIPEFPADGDMDNPKWVDKHVWQYDLVDLLKVLHHSGLKVVQSDESKSFGGSHFNMVAVSLHS
jgi:SAM-dependent methyltransferase